MTRSGIEEANGAQKNRGFANKGRATYVPAAAAHSHREFLGNEGGRCTKDRLEGRIHCLGHTVLLPHRSGPTRNSRPPRLHHAQREGWKWPFSLYGGRSFGFSLAPWYKGLIKVNRYECLRKKKR